MCRKELFRRYIIFSISLFIIALGISLVTRSFLGTSPISSTPYVFSLNTPLTMGGGLFILCLLFIVVQILMLGKEKIREKSFELLIQIPISFIFGACTDISMLILSNFNPEIYAVRILALVVGCFILALGICFEVVADVAMMGGEYTVQIAAKRYKLEFGTVKIIFDATLVTIAVVSSLLFSSRIEGVREGTIIAAVITGPFVKLIMPHLNFIKKWQSTPTDNQNNKIETDSSSLKHPVLINISREYGSGGHSIGKMLANRLNIPFYDRDLVKMIAKEGDFSEQFVNDNEQNIRNSIIYKTLMQDYEAPLEKSLSPEDLLFVAQSKVLNKIAEEGSCVIVGRCSNFILNRYSNNIDVFLYADMEYKIGRIIDNYHVDPDKAESEIKRIDKARGDHYHYYTGKRWGDARNYQLTFNSGVVPPEQICSTIEQLYHKKILL